MPTSPRSTRHKLASFLVSLALVFSFVIPAYAQETSAADDQAALVPDAASMEATQDGTTDLETAQRTGCQGTLTIDGPTGDVRGQGLIWGWFADAATPFNPGGPVDLYRGDTFIASTATGASRDVGNVRPDVDTALGFTDGRTGWFFRIDWSTQPAGQQTYRVLGRTDCEWLEKTFSVNVNPTPPAPAASLSISDESRTLSSGTGVSGVGTSCIQYNSLGQCTQVSSVNTGFGSTCISRDAFGNCISYGNIGGTSLSDVNFSFTVTLSPASTQTVTVNYATADGSAVANTDYASMSGTLSFAPGETTKDITVRVYNRGGTYSNDRDFFVRLSNPNGASISDGEGRGLIRRNFSSISGCIQFDVNGNCISYGGTTIGTIGTTCIQYNSLGQCIQYGSGTGIGGSIYISGTPTCAEGNPCSFTVSMSGGTSATVTFTAAGSGTVPATAGSICGGSVDFVPTSGVVVVTPSAPATITISTCTGDTPPDTGPETFTVTLISTTSGTIVTATAIGTITG